MVPEMIPQREEAQRSEGARGNVASAKTAGTSPGEDNQAFGLGFLKK